ncbi:tetratricopeptide repeat protein [Dokdonella koreensis]|uniref:TPR repeat-containing protein n=1 Tax=Dokdonella koreensis DS-123 TaxID=1300342 RepID=A0A160DY01_9GAMM|nr:tetratricopeptide repeat protein [Dokdonella koreensis]ANB19221.1 TPR repeat-containing protein [Dokdonella koreensis DS-123]
MSSRFVAVLLLALAASAAPPLAAQPVLRPVPSPDVARLPPAQAAWLRETRASFDKTRNELAGEPLAQAYAVLASAYVRAGQYDPALTALWNAEQLSANDPRWIYAQGLVGHARGDDATARTQFQRAMAVAPDYLPIRAALASLQIQAGELDAARKLLADYVAKRQDQPLAYALLGDIALRQKRYPEAVTQYQQALRLDPPATRLYRSLAEAYQGAGNAAAAGEARAKAGEVPVRLNDPLAEGLFGGPGLEAVEPFAIDLNSATFFVSVGRYDAARESADAALRRKPADAGAIALRARIDAVEGRIDAARQRVQAALGTQPDNALLLLTQGAIQEMAVDDVGAQTAFQKAIAADPALSEARLRLGSLLMRTGRPADAVAQFRALTKLHPNDGEGWAQLLAAEAAAGRCVEGLREMNEVLATRPDYGFVIQLSVRAASTCRGATAEQRRKALTDGERLYKISGAGEVAEAYALALAANGKWKEAEETQAAALFGAVSSRDATRQALYREFYDRFKAKQLPDLPWATNHPLFKPERPTPAAKAP